MVIKLKKDLFKNYKECFKYLYEIKKFIYFIVLIFVVFGLIGFFIPAPLQVEETIIKFINELLEKTQNMSHSELVSFIFFNNLQSSFLGLIFGIGLGIFSLIVAMLNGYLLGFVALRVFEKNGFLSLFNILPHGIFELPAIFISLALGLKLGMFVFQKNKIKYLKNNLKKSLKTFIMIVIPFLIIAAIIEGTLIFLQK